MSEALILTNSEVQDVLNEIALLGANTTLPIELALFQSSTVQNTPIIEDPDQEEINSSALAQTVGSILESREMANNVFIQIPYIIRGSRTEKVVISLISQMLKAIERYEIPDMFHALSYQTIASFIEKMDPRNLPLKAILWVNLSASAIRYWDTFTMDQKKAIVNLISAIPLDIFEVICSLGPTNTGRNLATHIIDELEKNTNSSPIVQSRLLALKEIAKGQTGSPDSSNNIGISVLHTYSEILNEPHDDQIDDTMATEILKNAMVYIGLVYSQLYKVLSPEVKITIEDTIIDSIEAFQFELNGLPGREIIRIFEQFEETSLKRLLTVVINTIRQNPEGNNERSYVMCFMNFALSKYILQNQQDLEEFINACNEALDIEVAENAMNALIAYAAINQPQRLVYILNEFGKTGQVEQQEALAIALTDFNAYTSPAVFNDPIVHEILFASSAQDSEMVESIRLAALYEKLKAYIINTNLLEEFGLTDANAETIDAFLPYILMAREGKLDKAEVSDRAKGHSDFISNAFKQLANLHEHKYSTPYTRKLLSVLYFLDREIASGYLETLLNAKQARQIFLDTAYFFLDLNAKNKDPEVIKRIFSSLTNIPIRRWIAILTSPTSGLTIDTLTLQEVDDVIRFISSMGGIVVPSLLPIYRDIGNKGEVKTSSLKQEYQSILSNLFLNNPTPELITWAGIKGQIENILSEMINNDGEGYNYDIPLYLEIFASFTRYFDDQASSYKRGALYTHISPQNIPPADQSRLTPYKFAIPRNKHVEITNGNEFQYIYDHPLFTRYRTWQEIIQHLKFSINRQITEDISLRKVNTDESDSIRSERGREYIAEELRKLEHYAKILISSSESDFDINDVIDAIANLKALGIDAIETELGKVKLSLIAQVIAIKHLEQHNLRFNMRQFSDREFIRIVLGIKSRNARRLITKLFAPRLNSNRSQTSEIEFMPARGKIAGMIGYIADMCIMENAEIFNNRNDLHNVVIVSRKKKTRLLGGFILVEATTKNGEKILVIRGNNPLETFINEHSVEDYMGAVIEYAKRAAINMGFTAVFLALSDRGGAATNRSAIAQYILGKYASMPRIKIHQIPFNGYDLSESCVEVARAI